MPQRYGSGRAEFAVTLKTLRADRGMSLSQLAAEMHFHRGYVGNVEQGKKFPERQFAALADDALHGGGLLLRAWQQADEERREHEHTGKLLSLALKDSHDLANVTLNDLDGDQIVSGVQRLAVGYLGTPPEPIFRDGAMLRSEVIARLHTGRHQLHEQADMYLTAGRLSGILAYAALDLGHPKAAVAHAKAAWTCANMARDNELRAWVRGTQSLIARFQGHYDIALTFARDGLRYAGRGTSEARLRCGEAQCLANLGDAHETNKALNRAETARECTDTADTLSGLFEFSEAKQRYYAGSSLIWLEDESDLRRAAHDAAVAIGIWYLEPPERRPLDDEALCHVYRGTALLRLGELDEAATALRPVLDLPPERRISWIGKRLTRVADILGAKQYAGSTLAQATTEEIRAFTAA